MHLHEEIKRFLNEQQSEDDIIVKVPKKLQENAREGLELREKYNRGGTEVGVNTANMLLEGEIPLSKVRHISKYFPRHAKDNLNDKTSAGYIAWQLWGGDEAWEWTRTILEEYGKR